MANQCAVCHKEANFACGDCHEIYYYDRECQEKDWCNHKNTCKGNTSFANEWKNHVKLTRDVLLLFITKGKDSEELEMKIKVLLQNQVIIGEFFRNRYGKKFTKSLIKLLKEHITMAYDIMQYLATDNDSMIVFNPVTNTKEVKGDGLLNDLISKWYSNGNDIANILNDRNDKWELSKLNIEFENHLRLTLLEFIYQINNEEKLSLYYYDGLMTHMTHFAIYLSKGL